MTQLVESTPMLAGLKMKLMSLGYSSLHAVYSRKKKKLISKTELMSLCTAGRKKKKKAHQ